MVQVYEVGGCVRDDLLGLSTKDVDYSVVAESFDEMRAWLTRQNFEIFLETPQYHTIRARFPRGMTVYARRNVAGLTADFVLARKDGAYTDGRRPDSVEQGTLYDDLRRRDFTVNAMARDAAGELIDPHNGLTDLCVRNLRAVGSAEDRLREDALRALRAIMFVVTKDFIMDESLRAAVASEWLPPLLATVSVERRREELLKAFKVDTLKTLSILHSLPLAFRQAVFSDGLWLEPSLKGH
jgi:tRNA nucleotidyltransferase (CCA-adding enzyme)